MPTDESLLTAIRRERQRLRDDGPAFTRSDGDFEVVSLPPADCDALSAMLVEEQVRVVVEVGLAYGASALAIAEALVSQGGQGAAHLIIDPFQDRFHEAGSQVLASAGLTSLCRLARERSQLALPRLLSEGVVADAAFVDGSHIFHNVFVDLYYVQEIVRPGGLVVLDDCDWASVRTAVRYFEVNSGWREVPTPGPTRLRAYRLPNPRFGPRFEDFKPFHEDDSA